MRTKSKRPAHTLTEMTVVIATVALLATFGLPAIRAFLNSFESQGGAKAMISAGLASARAIAAKEQRYAGIRFQKAYHTEDPLQAPQYMVFIVHDFGKTGLAPGFRAVEGLQPIKLPDSVGVMDLRYRPDLPNALGDGFVNDNREINDPEEVIDTTSFSVIFSPSGKLVIHDVRVRNKDGKTQGTEDLNKSKDDVFNTFTKITHITNPYGMFIQDDYASWGLGKEQSRGSFIIYERDKFRQAYEKGRAWSDYLVRLAPEAIYINPYTGTIISTD